MRLRILFIAEAIPPYCGGGEQVAWMNAVALAGRHDVSVLTLGERERREVRDGVEVHYLKRPRHRLLYFATAGRSKLQRCITAIDPDVIHSHMPDVLHFCMKKGSRTLVSTIHDGVPETRMKEMCGLSPYTLVKNKLIRAVNIYKSDFVTCVSQHNHKIMTELYPYKKDRFSVIPNGIHSRYFTPVRGVRGEYALNFGRQIALKMEPLLGVASLLPELPFKFVGTGPMARDWGLSNVEFLGFHAEFVEVIDNALLCVFPSLSENFPLVGLEAMARGKPIIATRIGFSEYVEDGVNGLLLDDVEPESIAVAIERLMRDECLYGKICEGARRTAEDFRFENVAGRYEELYCSLRLQCKNG